MLSKILQTEGFLGTPQTPGLERNTLLVVHKNVFQIQCFLLFVKYVLHANVKCDQRQLIFQDNTSARAGI